MRLILLLLLFSASSPLVFSQQVSEPKVKFGDFSLADLDMKSYDKDSSADAVVLYDYGQTTFDLKNGILFSHFVYHGRVKILKKSALDRGTISLSLAKRGYGKDEMISDIKGFTYNIENNEAKKEKLTKESIFTEKITNNYQTVKFTMPNVKEGSVIDYSYSIDTPFGVSSNPKTWTFQGNTPVMWSIYEITIPSYFTYRMLMSGYLVLTDNITKNVNISLGSYETVGTFQRFVVKDAPALRHESYITTVSDYISKIDFELASVNWPGVLMQNFSLDYASLNKTMLDEEMFGGQFKRTGFLSDIAKEIKSKHTDSTARLKAACEYIHKHVKWDESYNIYSKNIKKVLESQKGDAGDINLLLIGLLREIGFDANPVILSTREHGNIHEQFALLKRFNYVLAHIERNGKDFLMDATDEQLKLGMLPVDCLNQRGWLVHPTQSRFVSLTPTEKDIEFEKAELVIDEEGELKGSFTKSYGGYSSWSARKTFKQKGQEVFLEDVKKGKPSWTIEKAEYINHDEIDKAMEAHYQIALSDYVTKAGNMIYLKPMLSEGHTENPFKAKERLYPIDFAYPVEETFIASFELPKDYSVLEYPKNISLSLPENGGKFTYIISIGDNKLIVSSRLQFRKPVYYADEYEALQIFLDKIVAKHSEQIVLKKK